jgi:hypothetical protein
VSDVAARRDDHRHVVPSIGHRRLAETQLHLRRRPVNARIRRRTGRLQVRVGMGCDRGAPGRRGEQERDEQQASSGTRTCAGASHRGWPPLGPHLLRTLPIERHWCPFREPLRTTRTRRTAAAPTGSQGRRSRHGRPSATAFAADAARRLAS